MKHLILLFLFLTACKNPLSGGDSSQIDQTYAPGYVPGAANVGTDFNLSILFANSGNFTLGDSSVEFVGGVARLKALNQTDDSTNFGSGVTLNNLLFDGSVMKLNTTDDNSELAADWAPQWSSIVAYWKFNEAAGAASLIDSGPVGTHSLSSAGSTPGAAGRLKSGVNFNGAGGLPTSIDSSSNTYTIVAWIKPSAGSMSIFGNDGNAYNGKTFGLASNVLAIHNCHPSACNDLYGDIGVPSNQWSHVAVSVNAGTASFYVNGNPAGGGSPVETFGVPWVIGNNGSGGSAFNGNIDELAFWSTALSPSEVYTIYSRQMALYTGQMTSRIFDATAPQNWTNLNIKTSAPYFKELSMTSESASDYPGLSANLMNGLQAIWHLNDASGATTIVDSSGHSNTAPNHGAILGSQSLFSTGAKFDGGARWIELPTALEGQTNLTFNIWFQTTDNGVIISDSNASPGGSPTTWDPLIYVGTDGRVRGGDYCGGPVPVEQILSTSAVNDGRWHLATLTGAASGEQIFIDGVSIGAVPCVPAAVGYLNLGTGFTNSWAAGNNSWFYFKGFIDEVSAWNRVLSSAEILEIYRRGANRIKYQVRSCASLNCADQNSLADFGWRGPDNSNLSYFSEMNNTSLALPLTLDLTSLNASLNPKRYFQYRAIFESDDSSSPMLQSVGIYPTHYNSLGSSVKSIAAVGTDFLSLSSFAASASCSAGARYSLSSDGNTFYYWNGSAWGVSTNYASASDAVSINSQIASFANSAVGHGTLQVETFLKSDGASSCSVNELQVAGKK